MLKRVHYLFKQVETWFRGGLRPHKKFTVTTKWRRTFFEVDLLEDRLVPAVFNVNSLADLLNPPAGTVTLRSAIQAANATPGGNTINLTVGGTYTITIPGMSEDNNATGDFDILPSGGDLTIQNTSGQAVTVDGNHLDRVFDINPATASAPANCTVTFGGPQAAQGFTITGGVTPVAEFGPGSGGGIEDRGNVNLTLNNMVVTGNTANDDGGGVAMWDDVNASWTLRISNSTISNNHVGDAGGGVFSNGTGTILIAAGTVLSGNFAYNYGGGVWLDSIGQDSADLTMDGTVVSNNQAFSVVGIGGGIGNDGNGAVTITQSTVQNNSAGTTGGGFGDRHGLGSLSIRNSLFSVNVATSNGGGIAAGGPSTAIVNSEIDANSSGGSGGGLFADGTTLTVGSSTFANNTANGNGGGIEMDTTGAGLHASTITDVTITGNRTSNSPSAQGGGIDAGPGFTGSLNLLNDTINSNSATNGGGLFWTGASGSQLLVQNTILAQNSAGTGPDANNPANNITDQGGNVIGVSGTGSGNTGFTAASTQTGTPASPLNPLLGPLQNNGGPTIGAPNTALTLQTEALLAGSPAIGNGILTGAPAADEAGFPSVVDGLINAGSVRIVNKASTSTVIASSAAASVAGEPVTFTATVAVGTPGSTVPVIPTGVVTFFDGPTSIGQGTLTSANGTSTASFSTSSLTGGSHTITASYDGDRSFLMSRDALVQTVSKASTSTVLQISAAAVPYNQPVVLTAIVTSATSSAGTLAGTVTFLDQGTPLATVGLSGNTALLTTSSLSLGGHLLSAAYTGDDSHTASASSAVSATIGTPSERFVGALYVSLLHRQPDAGGLAAWVAALKRGVSRFQVALAFEQSLEARSGQVQALYHRFLHRDADSSGLTTFTAFLGAGGTPEQVSSILTNSPEYLQVRGGGTNAGFVTALYEDVLSRSPDAGGLAAFTQALSRGTSCGQVAAAIFGSPEYLQHLVASFYEQFLNRAADAGGLNSFVSALKAGVPDQAIITAMLGSDEFFAQR